MVNNGHLKQIKKVLGYNEIEVIFMEEIQTIYLAILQ